MAGFDNEVVYGSGIDLSGNTPVENQLDEDGKIYIGSTSGNPQATVPTSSDNILAVTPGDGTLDFQAGSLIKGGTAGQVLTSNGVGVLPSYQDAGGGSSPLTTKGDLYTYTTEDARLGVGSNELTLIADTAQTEGIKWGVLQEAGGGTAQSTYSTGNILYASATNTLSKLSPGGIPGGKLIIGFDNVVQWFDPRKHCILYEEFCTAKTDSGGTYNWDANSNSGTLRSNSDAVPTNPGFVKLETGGSSSSSPNICLYEFGGNGGFVLGGGRLYLHWIIKLTNLSDATDTYLTQVGLGDIQGTAQDNGIWFEYTHSVNSGNWTIKAEKGGTQTSANTSTAVTTDWVVLGIEVNADATSVSYYVNGSEVSNSPITTNIPDTTSNNIGPFSIIAKSAGTNNRAIWLDQFYLYQELTVSR